MSSSPFTIPSGPSECYTRLPLPTMADTTCPTPNGRPTPSKITNSTTSSYVPDRTAIRPLMSIEIRPPAIPTLMSIQTTPLVPCCNVNIIDSRFPTCTGYPRDISVPRTYGNTSGVSGSAPIRPLMSIHTTPPVQCCNFNNLDISFPMPYGDPMPRDISAPRTYGSTSCVRGSAPIRPLMSIQTSPPMRSSGIRSLSNRRSVAEPTAPATPRLMSIQTRPPRVTRLPHPPG